jgi:hypothetical protein
MIWRNYSVLPKVPSSYPLSPQRGEKVRVRGDKKKLIHSQAEACHPFAKSGAYARAGGPLCVW